MVEMNGTHKKRILSKKYRQFSEDSLFQVMKEVWSFYSELTARGHYCIGDWLKKNGLRRIVVCCKPVKKYGMGFQFSTMDKLIISELAASEGIEVVGLITQTVTTLGNIPIMSINGVNADPSIDAIIVPEPEIYTSALHHLGERTVFLHQILCDIHWYHIKAMPMLQTLNTLRKNGHQTLFVASPCVEDIDSPSEWEKFIIDNGIINGSFGYQTFPEAFELSRLSQKYATLDDYESAIASNRTSAQGFVVQKDYYVERLILDGQNVQSRYVEGCPTNYDRTVYMFGNSVVAGRHLEERDSNSSALQSLLNNAGISAKVLNLGVDGQEIEQLAYRISDSYIAPNSVVVVIVRVLRETQYLLKSFFDENNIPFCASIDYFQRPHDMGEVFLNAHHPNHNGNKKIAELIYQNIFETDRSANAAPVQTLQFYQSLATPPEILAEYYDPLAQSAEFKRYIQTLSQNRRQDLSRIGAIVMNCNPFTLGHQYLIENCAAKVDWLYVFVVEENRSVFPFSDRINLVRQGVQHLPNVSVFPSGSFMISTLTFPEYFRKDDLKELQIDPSADVELFGKHIAPALGITVRFAGEEPLDPITAQYNAAMARILPQFNVEFQVIARKESDGAVISASRVRELMKNGKFAEIEKLVPKTTMDCLIEKYFSQAVVKIDRENRGQAMLQLLDLVLSGKYSHLSGLAVCLQALAVDNPLLCAINDLDFIVSYQELYLMLWQGNNFDVLDIMTGMLLSGDDIAAEKTFLTLYVNLAAMEEQIDAFLFGNIRFAQFLLRCRCIDECRSIVNNLIEMGAGTHEDVISLRQALEDI